jgi:RNA polymerase sigma factor (sigma-70 family)
VPKATLGDVLVYLRMICATQEARGLSDGDLLGRFLASGDQDAFSVLVQRYGPMVYGVCKRVLGDVHIAEDAFQAVFMVLVRRAGSISRRKPLGGWLHAVARRIALKARAQSAARRDRERRSASMMPSDFLNELTQRELRTVLDEEIGRLPEKYRVPIVLCYLEGKTQEQAAVELGWPASSLTRRVGRARELLRQRLVRHGITLTAGALTAALGEKALAAPVPAMLAINTVKAAMSIAAGKAMAAGCVSAQAVLLAEETLGGMLAIKGKLVVLVLALGLVIGGAGLAGYRGFGEKEEPAKTEPPQSPLTKVEKRDFQYKTTPAAFDSHGDPLPVGAIARLGTLRLKHNVPLEAHSSFPASAATGVFSPDGKWIASVGDSENFFRLRLWDASSGKELSDPWNSKKSLFITTAFVFSPDGATFAIAGNEIFPGPNRKQEWTIKLWDITTFKLLRTIPLEPGTPIFSTIAFADSGKTLLTFSQSDGTVRTWDIATGKQDRSWKPIDDKNRPTEATGTEFTGTLSPGAKYLAVCVRRTKGGRVLPQTEAVGVDLAGGHEPWRVMTSRNGDRIHFAFSGDSKRVAILLERNKVELRETATGSLVGSLSLAADADDDFNQTVGPIQTRGLALSPDGNTVAVSGFSQVLLWNPDDPTKSRTVAGRVAQSLMTPTCLAFSPDG